MRRIETLADAQVIFRQLLDWQTKFDTSGVDLHGLQVRNAGAASKNGDYVVYEQLQDLATKVNNINSADGIDAVIHFPGGFSVNNVSGVFTNLMFKKGVLVKYS